MALLAGVVSMPPFIQVTSFESNKCHCTTDIQIKLSTRSTQSLGSGCYDWIKKLISNCMNTVLSVYRRSLQKPTEEGQNVRGNFRRASCSKLNLPTEEVEHTHQLPVCPQFVIENPHAFCGLQNSRSSDTSARKRKTALYQSLL